MQKTKHNTPPLNIALAYQGFVDEPVPSAIFDSIESGSAKRLTLIAIVIGALLAGVAMTMLFNAFNPSDYSASAADLTTKSLAVSAHNVYATDLVHPVQVNATDLDHLHNWLSYRVGTQLSLTSLSDVGFTLLGASAIPDGMTTSSMAVYENNKKERISVFTRYATDATGAYNESGISVDKAGELNVLSWAEEGALHTMVSNINSKTLRNIVDTHN